MLTQKLLLFFFFILNFPFSRSFSVCICSTGMSNEPVYVQSAYPFNFDTIFNLFHRYHYRILIRLPDGNRPTDFEMTFWFDIWPMCSQDTIAVESVSKRKNQSSITNEVFLDVQLRVSQISLMRKFLLCTYCHFALVNLFSPTVNLVPPLPYNWKWCSTTSIPIKYVYTKETPYLDQMFKTN